MSIIALLCMMLVSGIDQSPQENSVDNLIAKSKTFWYNNRDSALYYLNNALVKARAINYRKGEADALKGIGFLSESATEKLISYIRALEIRREINDSVGIGVSLYDLGTIYNLQLNDTTKMLDYIRRSLAIRKKINEYGGVAVCLISLGHHQKTKANYSKALELYKEALHYRLKSGELNGIAFAHVNMSEAYLLLKQYDSSLYFSTLAMDEFVKANNTVNMVWAAWVMASSYYETGQYDRALATLRGFQKTSARQSLDMISLLSKIYEKKNDYKQALKYQRMWIEESAAREAADNATVVRNLAADYEFKIKQEELRQGEERRQLEKQRQNNLQFLLIAVLIVIGFLSIIFLRRKASQRVLNISVFLVFIFLFEFLIVLIDPSLQAISGNTPFYLLLGNAAIALIIAPIHHAVDKYFKKVIASRQSAHA
jgi:tetratricopeptide (TPR) repeat protein